MAETKPKKQNGPVRKVPQRRCVGCGGTFEKRELLRIVRSPLPREEQPSPETDDVHASPVSSGMESSGMENTAADRISIDFTGKRSGRGAYICKNEACLAKARKNGRLHTSLECEITDALYAELLKEIQLG